jgi:hypothetical protein
LLQSSKPIIVCGDLNVANEDIDLNLLDGDFLPPFPGLNDGEKEIWIGEKYNYLDEVELVRNFINGRTDIMNSINQYNNNSTNCNQYAIIVSINTIVLVSMVINIQY